MKPVDIVALAVRLFAVVLAIYTLANGSSLIQSYFMELIENTYYIALTILVYTISSISLWAFSLPIARKLISFQKTEEAENITPIDPEQLQIVGLTLLGVYFLYGLVSDVAYWGIILFINQRNHSEILLEDKALMFATLFEIIFVLFLLLNAKGFSKLLYKFRYGNISKGE